MIDFSEIEPELVEDKQLFPVLRTKLDKAQSENEYVDWRRDMLASIYGDSPDAKWIAEHSHVATPIKNTASREVPNVVFDWIETSFKNKEIMSVEIENSDRKHFEWMVRKAATIRGYGLMFRTKQAENKLKVFFKAIPKKPRKSPFNQR